MSENKNFGIIKQTSTIILIVIFFSIGYIFIRNKNKNLRECENNYQQAAYKTEEAIDHMRFYIKESLVHCRLNDIFYENSEIISNLGNRHSIETIFSESKQVALLFSPSGCQTCYGIQNFSQFSHKENIPELIIITHIDNYADMMVTTRDFEINATTYAYDDIGILKSNVEASIFVWDGLHNEIRYYLALPKQDNELILDYYSTIISKQ